MYQLKLWRIIFEPWIWHFHLYKKTLIFICSFAVITTPWFNYLVIEWRKYAYMYMVRASRDQHNLFDSAHSLSMRFPETRFVISVICIRYKHTRLVSLQRHHISGNADRFAIMHRARQCHCRALCKFRKDRTTESKVTEILSDVSSRWIQHWHIAYLYYFNYILMRPIANV